MSIAESWPIHDLGRLLHLLHRHHFCKNLILRAPATALRPGGYAEKPYSATSFLAQCGLRGVLIIGRAIRAGTPLLIHPTHLMITGGHRPLP